MKLVDGARDLQGQPVVYFSRTKFRQGTYVLFYRAAWNSVDGKEFYRGGKLQEGERLFVQECRKLVLSMMAPKGSQIQMTRLSTKFYDKYLFLQMKQLYISKFES